MSTSSTWVEGDDCECCGEPETSADPIAHYWDDNMNIQVMAHGQCGLDHGLRLA